MDQKNYQKNIEDIIISLDSNLEEGLTDDQVLKRRETYGFNQLDETKKRSWFLRFFDQINDFMIYVLIAASILSFVTDEISEGFLILAIVLINAALGLFQEAKAEKALESIKAMSSPHAKVLRNGTQILVDVKEITVGDIVILDAGDYVPADVRIIESINLKTDESPLTGEALPVEKTTQEIKANDVALGDRTNLGFMGTVVTYGRGKAIVTDIAMKTQLGKIATMLSETKDEDTPLQQSMAKLGKTLAILALGITFIIFAITIGEAYIIDGSAPFEVWKEALLTSIALAVAAIPEGLPAIITIVLALGMQNLVKKQAIIRTLPAVETLGSTSIICSDKTGTLTQNLMTVTKVFTNNNYIDINEKTKTTDALDKLALMGNLCNDTKVSLKDDEFVKIGDPTEIAFIDLSIILKKDPIQILKENKRLYELPFDSTRKMMTTVHDFKDGRYAVIKGAPDVIFGRSKNIEGQDKKDIKVYEDANQEMANQALRVLAVAYKKIDKSLDLKTLKSKDLENDLTLLGLIGMIDPARPEAKDAIELCNQAGIKTIMITGDHINTAVAIAKDLKILSSSEIAITGKDLDKMDDEAFYAKLESIRVYARVSPENKVRIVDAWRKAGKVVAMTGDGVNDAPSIKKADIGIAMGITGTEVAKGAADMVLTDDNFSTIVNAVSEGRTIFANIKKAIHFLLSCNIGEIITIFLGTTLGILVFSGRVTTLTAVQILWVNLVTDSLMAIALGLEPKEDNIMQQMPRDAKKSIFADGLGKKIAFQGLLLGFISFGAYTIGWYLESSALRADKMMTAQTMTFIVLALSQLAHAFNVRSQTSSIFKLKRNKYIYYALFASLALQLIVVFLPFTREIFGITTLSIDKWLIIIGLVSLPIVIVELSKLLKNIKA
ncbi:MAG: calcium-translocating P-type ATPase, PMCA-type [Acholeplasmataceae bacterium]|nr:calcium-translocating P-type ATPase, PMCA-type [Acholeplasmataceae bacterium]